MTVESLVRARKERIGIEGYVRILAMLRTPMSSAQVIEATGLDRINCNRILRHFRRAGLIHREQWFRPNPHSRMLPMWALGGDGDVPNPGYECPTKVRPSSSMLTLITIIQVLKEEPRTMAELCEEVGMVHCNVARVVKFLRNAKLSRVVHWVKPPMGHPYAAHGYCEQWTPDQRKPKPADRSAQAKKWKETFQAKRAHLAMVKAMAGAMPVSNEELEAA